MSLLYNYEVNIPRQDPSNKIYYMFPLSSVGGIPSKEKCWVNPGNVKNPACIFISIYEGKHLCVD